MIIVNAFVGFKVYGGAASVAFQLYSYFKNIGYTSIISSFNKFEEIHDKYNVDGCDYKRIEEISGLKDDKVLIFSHQRKVTHLLLFLKIFGNYNYSVVHVSHNEFRTFKFFRLYPENNIAVSERVKGNMIQYFGVKNENIEVIYNGIEDLYCKEKDKIRKKDDNIKILYAARINSVKRQVQLVNELKGKINQGIQIHFAGIGDDYKLLKDVCENSESFICLGFKNIDEIIYDYDYIMLFSTNEGLPLSLIEGCMYRKPLIANNVGGNSEIINNNCNGFVVSDYNSLIKLINKLHDISNDEYEKMASCSRDIYEKKFRYDVFVDKYENYVKYKAFRYML